VKFADTQKEKDQKRLHQMAQNIWSMSSVNNIAALAPQYLSVRLSRLIRPFFIYIFFFFNFSGTTLNYGLLVVQIVHTI
jgi:hypothetical protein